MEEYPVCFNKVSKKFSRGEHLYTLRDLFPALASGLFTKSADLIQQRDEFWCLREVDFSLKRGETLGIIGPNGAGKSTILKLVAQVLKPNEGTVATTGRIGSLIDVGAGFQLDLSGRENIFLNASIMGMRRREIVEKFDRIVEFSGLIDYLDTPIKRYSTGMFARLGFSVAAHLDPDILLVDEVLSVGDLAFQAKCREKIGQLNRNGSTIIFISHNMQTILELCKRVIYLDNGVVQIDGPATESVRQYIKGSRQKFVVGNSRSSFSEAVGVRIVTAKLFNAAGEESSFFPLDADMIVRIALRSNRLIADPDIALAFFSSTGIKIYEHHSKVDGWSAGDIDGERQIEVRYAKIKLLPGDYLITVAIIDGSGIAFDIHHKAYGFTIQGGSNGAEGLVVLPHEWQTP